MSEWFYEAGTGTRGPVPPEEVRRLLAVGAVTPDTLVWCPAERVEPTPLRGTPFGVPDTPRPAPWHYERAGARVGPVDAAELHRLLAASEITRDTLVWSPEVGTSFVPLGTTALAPPITQPPALPASRVDDTLVWVLAVIPLAAALIEQATGGAGGSIWGWPLLALLTTLVLCFFDERRLVRSGNADPSAKLRVWVILVPVYLYRRARALRGPRHYLWAWVASFVASLFVGADLPALLRGDAYLWAGLPACNSAFEQRQVRQLFDGLADAKAAGLTAVALANPRELGQAGDLRTCAAQLTASNAVSYRVVYTVELQGDQVFTRLQVQN